LQFGEFIAGAALVENGLEVAPVEVRVDDGGANVWIEPPGEFVCGD
jgi:hypothetical protein